VGVGVSGSEEHAVHLLGGLDGDAAESSAGRARNSLPDPSAGGRSEALGFVYQFHHLLMEFSATENVAMPLLIRRMPKSEAYDRAATILREVGLGERLDHTPGQLSGGQRQRAALARALVTRPACVLADEPTGNLDRHTAASVYELMLELNRAYRTRSCVIVTHDPALAARADRVLRLDDGWLAPA
jgi:lipoprotein-releasing system ATP-binding protein